ncbi:hypothetical protein ACFXDE_31425 [Kitasatospora sp. NPDC059408]|uniref:hypothetical protein n=1 Tax=Kitasatospora sp. NPDC059408 TaxID=3346823 RepID=UPI003695BF91
MTKNQLRMAAVTVVTALALGSGAGMASATEQHNVRLAQATVEAHALAQAFEGTPAPTIVEDGLEDRLADLPEDASLDQVVQAMYPDDEDAQASALAYLTAASDDASSDDATGTGAPEGAVTPQFWGWGDAWHLAKCVGAVGGFIAGNALAVSKIRKFGGVVKLAKLLIKGKNFEQRMKALLAAFGDISGLGAVASSCG